MDPTHPFTTAAARAHGVTDGVLRSRRWIRPTHGTRAHAAAAGDPEERFREAIMLVARSDAFFSHTTAAILHGMPVPAPLARGPLHVASPSLAPRMRRPGVVGHRIRAEVAIVDGRRVEVPVDTLVHMATLLDARHLVPLVDWVLRPRGPGRPGAPAVGVATLAEISERMLDFRGARGLGRLRTALGLARPGAESPRESELRLLVVDAGFPAPELGVEVRDRDEFVARLDMAWPDLRIALEYDGEQHRTDPRQFARDIERLAGLERLGWIVVRVTKEHLRAPGSAVLPRLREAFARRGAGWR